MYHNFKFEILKKGTGRCGVITTPHGQIETPAFIFCATKGVMKGATTQQMEEANTQVILSNTYHGFIRPGSEKIKSMGGLHGMMRWKRPMFSDSGGYQIFSMGYGSVHNDIGSKNEIKGNQNVSWKPTLKKIDDEGATFQSYFDKSTKTLTPEISIQVQRDLGADIILVFDECTPYNVTRQYTEQSMHRSHRWAIRCLDEFTKHNDGTQALYGIVQGSVYKDLRDTSIEFNNSNDFFGVAVGGSLGDSKEMMYDTVNYVMKGLRKDRPVHLLGIGGIGDIFNGVRAGVDTFDCVHPTRIARHGCALVKPKFWGDFKDSKKNEHADLTKNRYAIDRVIDEECECSTCKDGYTMMYLNYLFKIGETTCGVLVTIHNVHFMNKLMERIRNAIMEDRLDEEEKSWIN
jgi:queuine tRNA-ribosyltransferase